jgi:hypothetical protein
MPAGTAAVNPPRGTAAFRFHGERPAFLARERRGATFRYACARAGTLKHAVDALGMPHTEAGRLTVTARCSGAFAGRPRAVTYAIPSRSSRMATASALSLRFHGFSELTGD